MCRKELCTLEKGIVVVGGEGALPVMLLAKEKGRESGKTLKMRG